MYLNPSNDMSFFFDVIIVLLEAQGFPEEVF